MVRHAQQALGALAPALAATALGACGGGPAATAGSRDATRGAQSTRVVRTDLGPDYRLANCTDWRRGTLAGRRGTVAEIAGFAGGPVGNDNGTGNVLSPAQAYRLFEAWCSRPYARHFKLYKLYVRAAAFTPPQ